MLIKPINPCSSCPLCSTGSGLVPADGTGENGVLIVLEAAGAEEAIQGRPTVGKAGLYLWSQLGRVGINREGFRVHNVLSCQPNLPGFKPNFLAGAPYEAAAIEKCSPLLDSTILDMQERCRSNGKTFTILTLGRIAFKRVLGIDERDPLLKKDYFCYPFWSTKYQAWVLSAMHPSYLMRGNHGEVPILQFAARRAIEIAADGLTLDTPQYIVDPLPATFDGWVNDYIGACDQGPTILSYDIETPYKQGKNEEQMAAREDDEDYTILRCSFSYRPNHSISIPWTAQHRATLERLFAHPGPMVGWNNSTYDLPRIRANGIVVNGDQIDAMLAWHVLNSNLPKGLGYVTPFYAPTLGMWKHLSNDTTTPDGPALYNAKDADAALRCWLGIERDLKLNSLWHVFDRHVIELNRVLDDMSNRGLHRDEVMRDDVESKLTSMLAAVDQQIKEAIPPAAKQLKLFKKTPKSVVGMVQVDGVRTSQTCSNCGMLDVVAKHMKGVGKKRLKSGEVENPCLGATRVKMMVGGKVWAKPLDFKVSNTSLQRYQQVKGHHAVKNRQDGRVTFDENATKTLMTRYPNDPLYPLLGKQRYLMKLLGTYVGRTTWVEVEVPDNYQLVGRERQVENPATT